MLKSGNISLTRTEWESFEKKINTIDRERTRKAEAFLRQYDGIVPVHKDETKTDYAIPWLDDDTMLALLGVQEKRSAFDLQHFASDEILFTSAPRSRI